MNHENNMIFFLRNVYVIDDHMRYAIIPHKLKYPAISSKLMLASLRYDRRKNFSVAINTLRRKVIAIKRIRFLYFIVIIYTINAWWYLLFLDIFYFYCFVPNIHLLDLLTMGDGVEFHFSLFYKIFQHICYFSYRIFIEIVDCLI